MMSDLGALLSFAETVVEGSVVDAEHVRVCLPANEYNDCVLLLDAVNQVPPVELWEMMNQHAAQSYDSTNKVDADSLLHIQENAIFSEDSCAVKTPRAETSNDASKITFSTAQADHSVSMNRAYDELDEVGSPERDLPPKVLFSPMIEEMASDDIINEIASPQDTELCVAHEEEAPVEDTTEASPCQLEIETHVEDTKSAAPASEPACAPSMDFQTMVTTYRDRIETFNPRCALESIRYNGEMVYYWVTQTFRVKDNLTLAAAMRLSAELCVPLVAIAIVEDEVVQDVAESSHNASTRKRSIAEVRDSRETTESSYEQNLEALQRKSIVRLSILAHLREDLQRLNVPLVTISYNSSALQILSSNVQTVGQHQHGQALSTRHVVTPQRKSVPQHPLVSVLLALCGGGVDGISSSDAHSHVGAVTPFPGVPTASSGLRTPVPGDVGRGVHHAVSAGTGSGVDVSAANTYGASVTESATESSTVLSPAALFTDDCLHPLYCYVCTALAGQLPSLPVLSVDSNSLHAQKIDHMHSQQRVQVCSPDRERFPSYETWEKESEIKELVNSASEWPSAESLKDLLPGWEDATYCANALQQRLEALHHSGECASLAVLSAEQYKTVTAHPLHSLWSVDTVQAALHFPNVSCDKEAVYETTEPHQVSTLMGYVQAGVLSPRTACAQQPTDSSDKTHTTSTSNASTATASSTSILQTEYGRHRLAHQRDRVEISCRKDPATCSSHSWEVAWLDLLGPAVLQQIQRIDQQMGRNLPVFAPAEARRKLKQLYTCNTECEILNGIVQSLVQSGVTPVLSQMKYFFLYHVPIFGSFARAIKCTFRTLTLYSMYDISHNSSDVLMLLTAVVSVVSDVCKAEDSVTYGMPCYEEQVNALLNMYRAGNYHLSR